MTQSPGETVSFKHRYWNPGLYTYTNTGTPVDATTCNGNSYSYLLEVPPGVGAEEFAPLVYLHPTEYSWPMSAGTFVNKSRLMWSHDAGCRDHTEASTGTVRQEDLGAIGRGAYEHTAASNVLCRPQGQAYAAWEYTRPYDVDHLDRPFSLPKKEGFYLDLDNRYHYGTAPAAGLPSDVYAGAPVYSEVTEGVPGDATGTVAGDGAHPVITYWFFYGYSTPLTKDLGAHEGDWEHVNVHLNGDGTQPTQVDYFAHHAPANPVNFADVRKEGTHPMVYSAKSAHGSYPTAGESTFCDPKPLCTIDKRGNGRQWRTWEDVKPVEMQPWHGFGGAWGRAGLASNTTGPSGPSDYKDPLGHG